MKTEWLRREGPTTDGGGTFVSKKLAAFPDKTERTLQPVMISVGWAFDKEGSNRLPTPAEWQRIDTCEVALAEAAHSANAILVGSLTCDGFHQFVVYCKNAESVQIKLLDSLPKPVEKPKTAETWNLGATPDPDWEFAEKL